MSNLRDKKVTESKHLNKEEILCETNTMQNPKDMDGAVNDSEKLSFTLERANSICNCVADLRKKLCFDGINFWYKDECLGKISPELVFEKYVPKDIMIAEKERCIKEILLCEV